MTLEELETTMNAKHDTGAHAAALIISRVFDAPREQVFQLWSNPAHVKEWWHPRDFTTPVFEMDFRVGGTYRYSIHSKGMVGHAKGTYREIAAPERIVFTFRWESGDPEHDRETLVTVTFEARGEKTLLTFRQEPFASTENRDSHTQGWSQVLDAFGTSLATFAKKSG